MTDIQSLADYTPNLSVNTGASSVSNPTIFIRGIGLLDFNSNAASSVAIINDSVYQNSPLGQLFSFYDLENVQVLRGPMGSVDARNATAGVIKVQPKRPNGTIDARLATTFGNFGLKEFDGAVSFPILDDRLSARIAGRLRQNDGITVNRCGITPNAGSCSRILGQISPLPPPGQNFGPVDSGLPASVNNFKDWAARFVLRFQPTASQDWTLNVNGGQSRGYAYQFQSRGSQLAGNAEGIGQDALGYRDTDRDPFAGDYDLVEDENLDLLSAALNGTVEFDSFNLRWTTGYSQTHLETARNFDASPNQFAHVFPDNSVWQVVQEINLGSFRGADFEWDVGVFGLYERLDTTNVLLEGLIITTQEQQFSQKTGAWALYARGAYFVTEWLLLSGGVRYNWEQKTFDLTVSELPSQRFPLVQPRATRQQSEQATWGEPTGDIEIRWIPHDAVEVYGKYTRGFKSGHFNGGAFFSAQLIDPVEPEFVDAFEIGMRATFVDGLLQFNAAVWYYDYEDQQVFALENTEGTLPLAQLLNAPRAESRGVEMDLTTTPIDGMRFQLSAAILDAKFTEFTVQRAFVPPQCPPATPPCPPESEVLDFSGNPLVAAPSFSMSAVALYDIVIGRWGTLTPRIDTTYRGKTYFSPGDQTSTNLGPNEGASQEGYFLLNLRLGYVDPSDHFEVAFWVRNATNQIYLANSLDVRGGLGKYLDVYGEPRMYGTTFVLKW